MKTLMLFTILAASMALAGEALSVGPEPPSEYNAHWQILDAQAACVRDGMDVYGCNDEAGLTYMGQPINLRGYDGVVMFVTYSQKTADEGDYCRLYLSDSDYENILVHDFEDTDGSETADIMLDGLYGIRDLQICFDWVSDETGVDHGIRIYQIQIYGCEWGEGNYTNIFTWDSSEVTVHQTFDVTDLIDSNMCCLGFEYGTNLDTQGWWALDNVVINADGESVLPLPGGGYGVEDFESGGWYQDRHGYPGEWEIDTDHATGGMSGENWQCDSAAHPGWRYEAETLSPWVHVISSETVTVDFDTWFHPVGTDEYASLGWYNAREYLLFSEGFQDLDDWGASDGGENVTETSWGAIKASF